MIQNCIVIHINLKTNQINELSSPDSALNEAVKLASSLDLEIADKQLINLKTINPASYIGKGKVEELKEIIDHNDIGLVVFNNQLTPIQQRNLELGLKAKVIDRTALILEIFGKRANTKEGTLQVELAAFEYQKSRLVRSWTHLERQRGGGGFMGGPGEKQIESDRRVISDRITVIKKRIKKVAQTREIQRKSRKKIPYKTVSLVGYTNAGKSTLFNKLTGASTIAEDKLFATLDPTMRLIELPSGKKIILSDTVGFISNLPTELVAAFRATLEEVVEADLIVHVRDSSSPEVDKHKKDVLEILEKLGLAEKIDNNMIEVMNKSDLISETESDENITNEKIFLSALNGDGIKGLIEIIDEKLNINNLHISVQLEHSNGKAIAWLQNKADIISKTDEDFDTILELNISERNYGHFVKHF